VKVARREGLNIDSESVLHRDDVDMNAVYMEGYINIMLCFSLSVTLL
jgi:hypothetical protein